MNEHGRTKLDQFRHKVNELERAKKEADKLRQEAIAELLQQRKEINRELRQLGYEGVLEEPRHEPSAERSPARGIPPLPPARLFTPEVNTPTRGRRPSPYDPGRRCPICEIAGHDLRAHRGQTIHRRFTEDELVARGLIQSMPEKLSG